MTLSLIDRSALYKLEKYPEIILGPDDLFSVPDKYWSIPLRQMRRLEAAGHCRIDRVGATTFAVLVRRAAQ